MRFSISEKYYKNSDGQRITYVYIVIGQAKILENKLIIFLIN